MENAHRGNLRRLIAASAISNLGDVIRYAALPLLPPSWSASPLAVSGLAVAAGVPWLLFGLGLGLGAGVGRSRGPQAPHVAVDAGRCAVAAGVAVAVALDAGGIAVLYGAAFALALGETLFDTTAPVVVRSIVPNERRDAANGHLAATQTTGNELVGPAVGGLVFAAAAPAPFTLDAASFLLAGSVLVGVKGRFVPTEAVAPGVRSRTDLASGVRRLRGHELLRTLAILTLCVAAIDPAWFAILVLYVVETLELPDAAYGVIVAIGAVGGILAGIAAGRAIPRVGRSRSLIVALSAAAVAQLILGLTTNAAVAAAVLVVSAFALTIFRSSRRRSSRGPRLTTWRDASSAFSRSPPSAGPRSARSSAGRWRKRGDCGRRS